MYTDTNFILNEIFLFQLAANFLREYDLSVRLAASLLFSVAGERLIVTKSIKQLAFDGYRDIIILLSPLLKRDIPFKNGLFAWLYGVS